MNLLSRRNSSFLFSTRRSFSVLHSGKLCFSPLFIPLLGFSSVEAELHFGSFPAVKLNGLPHDLSPSDLAKFLNGLQPIDMVVQFRNGVATGNIGVLFKDKNDANEALKLHRTYIGKRYINVIRCRRDEYYHLIYQDLLARKPKYPTRSFENVGAVIKLDGLSYETLPHDVYRFCSDYIPSEHYVLVCATEDGLPSGRAYVQLSDKETAIKAQNQLDNKYLGIRKIRVSQSTSEEALQENNLYFK